MHKKNSMAFALATWAGVSLAASCGLQIKESPNVDNSAAAGRGGSPLPVGAGGNPSVGGAGGSPGTGGVAGGGSGGTSSGGTGVAGSAGRGGSGGSASSTGGADGGMAAGGTEGAPPSGVVVDINGVTVPKEKAIAFIHFGHSNMAGRGQAPANLRPYFFTDVDPHAWMFHATGANNGFRPAAEPFTAGDSTSLSGNSGGPGTALVKQAAAMAPDYHFISVGFGQNSLFCRNYAPGTTYFTAAMAGPMALKGKVTFAAIVIMLGITERHGTAADIAGYPDCINRIVTQIRTDLGLPDLPLMLTDYEMTATSVGEDLRAIGPFGQQIIPRIHAVPSFISRVHPINSMPPAGPGTVTKSALVPTEGLTLIDNHHFQLDAQKKWTQDLLDIMKEAGWFPWAKP